MQKKMSYSKERKPVSISEYRGTAGSKTNTECGNIIQTPVLVTIVN